MSSLHLLGEPQQTEVFESELIAVVDILYLDDRFVQTDKKYIILDFIFYFFFFTMSLFSSIEWMSITRFHSLAQGLDRLHHRYQILHPAIPIRIHQLLEEFLLYSIES